MLGLLASPLLRPLLAGVAVIAILGGAWFKGREAGVASEHRKAEKQIAAVQSDLAICKANAAEQKASLEAVARESDARVAASAKAASAARAMAESYRKASQAAMAAKRSTPNACADAFNLVRDRVK